MEKRQRGSSLLGLQITLVASITVGLFLALHLSQGLNPVKDALLLNQLIKDLSNASQQYYGMDVAESRCLTPKKELNVNRLISSNLLSPSIIQSNYQFKTEYELVNNGLWSYPAYIVVTVSFKSVSEINDMAGNLLPHSVDGRTAKFRRALYRNFGDSIWQGFDVKTGCYR
ncbi:hypothetical protein [Shewanella algae]|uniref:hypothetical protein n=1 Tax=Shewanella algae TaxID=38313 RepID=UPI001AAE0E67|nr:hypothetical protein [Shewanella algae]MBO2558954.1 hypothetical protein [Shewanella algae]MBO2575893.1 hypothetical protein [Shewanella algae]